MKRWLATLCALLSLGPALSACGNAGASSTTLETAAAVPTDPTAGLSETVLWEQAAHNERVAQWVAAEERNRIAAEAKARADRHRRQKAEQAALAALLQKNTPKTVGATTTPSDDFWRRLANCESPTGVVGRYVGYFQFSKDTAAKVGIDGSEDYETQKAAAIRWLGMIGGRGGSRSGWPHCWWVALRG